MFRFIQRTGHELVWLNIVFSGVRRARAVLDEAARLPPWRIGVPGGLRQQPDADRAVPVADLGARDHRVVDSSTGLARKRRAVRESRVLVGMVGYGLATVLALCGTEMSFVLFALVPLMYIVPAGSASLAQVLRTGLYTRGT